MKLLEASNLTKIYGSKSVQYKALDSLNIEMEKGEFIGVMGPSGSGKTTLLNMLSTIDQPTSGTIRINGKNLSSLSKKELALFRRRELGFIFQDFNLLNTLTAEENIILPLTLDNCPLKEMDRRLVSVAKQLHIDDILHKRTYELSGGQQQRIAIARAIIHNPSLVFADEPTGNLDSRTSKQVLYRMLEMSKNSGVTFVMVTHEPDLAECADRIVTILDGKVCSNVVQDEETKKKNRDALFADLEGNLDIGGEAAKEQKK